jgi:hypothetical protein
MFNELFAKFASKRIAPILKTEAELIQEFEKVKKGYASIATSAIYKLLKEYFEVKIEINRDALESLPLDEAEKLRMFKAEIKVMRNFLQDIEDMRSEYEREMAESAQIKVDV